MADTVVSFLLDNLSQLLQQEMNLLSGVEDKVKLLQKELEMINAFLKDSEGKRNEHETVKVVVSQIRDVANEAQDVIDNYIVNVIKQRKRTLVGKAANSFNHTRMLHEVNNQIETIKATIKDIYDNKDKYDIKEGDQSANKADSEVAELLRKRRRDVEEDEVVGFDQYSAQVIKLLKEGDSSLDVVSIIGMAGLGKTTLARKVFKDYQVNMHFDCCAWAYVSNEYRARDLLLSLLRSLMNVVPLHKGKHNLNRNNSDKQIKKAQDVDQLKKMVRECLTDERYLIVLDDVWKTQVWNEVKDAFPDDNNGSRILITSRSKEVASNTSRSTDPYILDFLSQEDSWKLFSRHVFQGEECPSDLEPLGKEIVASCKGLPLSIVVLAGLLRNKDYKSKREWSKIKGNVHWYLNQEETLVKDILRLSYDSLPRRLKPCFLYLGIYPEDSEIPVRQLIQLWIAEGFIQQAENRILEDVGEDYLEELINRSLIQVVSKRTDGGVKACRIHDLLRELCISESKEDKFFQVRTDVNIMTEGKPRRLSVHCSMPYYISESTCDHSCTRSLFCFDEDKYYFDSTHESWLLRGFKLIRVMDLGRVGLPSIPDKLDKLIHLRYLRIDTGPLSLPDSICDLWNLETLNVRSSKVHALPKRIWKLKRLRHLYMSGEVTLPEFSGSNSKIMPNLQTLSTVALNRNAALHLENGRFPNLRKLGFDAPSQERTPLELLQRLQCLTRLNALKIIYPKGFATSANGFPPNITKVSLVKVAGLNENSMNTLGSLPNLRILKISGIEAAPMFVLHCNAEGFQQLHVFQITSLPCERWKLAEGAMPRLRRLVINKCECLTSLPDELWSLTAVQEVELLWPTRAIVDVIQNLDVKPTCKLTIYPPAGEDPYHG